MKIKSFNRKIFCLCFVVLTLLGCLYIRGTRYASIDADYRNIELGDCLIRINEYVTSDGKNFLFSGNDPWLLLDFASIEGGKVENLVIDLKSEIDLTKVQVFYGREFMDFSEADSTILSGQGKIIQIDSLKAAKGFRYLRLDIDTDFCIDHIRSMRNYSLVYNSEAYKYIWMAVLSLVISIVVSFGCKFVFAKNKFVLKVHLLWKKLVSNRWALLKKALLLICVFGVVLLVEYIYHIYSGNSYMNLYRVLIFSCMTEITVAAVLYRNIRLQSIHIYYFILLIVLGTITILIVPPVAQVVWDDEIHYSRAAELSWGEKGLISYTDAEVMAAYPETYHRGARKDWQIALNSQAELIPALKPAIDRGKPGAWVLAYVPSAIGLMLGRGLGLSFTNTFMLGKWMNLLCYSILVSLSVKMIKGRGKILAAVIGIIPTSLYMASSYSYDWWVISFIVYGYALFIKEMQLYKEIRLVQFAKIFLIIILGLLPKMIYFPLLLPIIFLGSKRRNMCGRKALLVCGITVLSVSMLLLILLKRVGMGDIRGGTEVNATEQIKFIFNYPLQYTRILLNFLKTYLSPDNAGRYLTELGYYGNAEYYSLCLLVIGIVTFLDNSDRNEPVEIVRVQKATMLGICFISIVLVATAFYVAFTPVATDTIKGCQYRYILPIVFPFLYFIGKMNICISEQIKTKMFIVTSSVISFVYLYGLYDLRVRDF